MARANATVVAAQKRTSKADSTQNVELNRRVAAVASAVSAEAAASSCAFSKASQCLEENVHKQLYDMFNHWSDPMEFQVEVHGHTLAIMVREYMQAEMAGAGKVGWGTTYYKAKALLFTQQATSTTNLTISLSKYAAQTLGQSLLPVRAVLATRNGAFDKLVFLVGVHSIHDPTRMRFRDPCKQLGR